MELPIKPDEEYLKDDILFYTKQCRGDKEICLICHFVNKKYDKYKLKCNHTYHTRCFRRYCFFKDAIKCPLCNDIDPFDEFKEYIHLQ